MPDKQGHNSFFIVVLDDSRVTDGAHAIEKQKQKTTLKISVANDRLKHCIKEMFPMNNIARQRRFRFMFWGFDKFIYGKLHSSTKTKSFISQFS